MRETAGSDGEIIEKKWRTRSDGSKGLDFTYRKPVDLLGEAKKEYEYIGFSDQYFIDEDIGDYKILGPAGPSMNINECGIVKGSKGVIEYIFSKNKGNMANGSSVHVFIADKDNELDREYLSDFYLSYGVNIKTRKDGQVVVVSNSGNITSWKTNSRTYYRVSNEDHVVLEAYLKKFPSILPKDYKVDEKAWKKEEVGMCLERMKEDSMQKEDKNNRYLWDYIYISRFIEPIPGAPLGPPWKIQLTEEDRMRHFYVISKWWEKNKDKVTLRPGRPLSHEAALHLIPESNMESAEVALKKFREGLKANKSGK